ncbi:MAG: S9 family peptidase [Proteobacteria bacterium]|nr:S9 family peptidase [Pseudomonadota bacterium]MDA0992353.1 S9 family peptidase [Pseudomonadota bacterium]
MSMRKQSAWGAATVCKTLCLLSLALGAALMARATETSELLSIDRIFHDEEFDLSRPVPSKWLGDGDEYTTVQESKSVTGGFDIVRHDSATGRQTTLVRAEQLVPAGTGSPIEIKDYAWSDDGRFVLINTNTVKFRRLESFGDYWLLNLDTGNLRQLGKQARPSALMYAKFSPDSRHVAYMFDNNLYIESTEGINVKQLTHDGSDLIVNGTGDWVNEEEFDLRDGFKWSPDSKRLCYWQFDTEGVGTFYMMKNTDDVYSHPIPLQYPKAGTTNSATRVGTVDIESAKTVWIALEGDPRQNYVPRMGWAANSGQVIIQYVNRLQNRNQVILANANDGSSNVIFTDEDEAWLDVNDDPKWLEDGASFTWLSERDGWRHLYQISRDGKDVRLLSPGEFDIIRIENIDADSGWVYYIASPDDNAARYLYRSPLSGEPMYERLTPVATPAFHEYEISPNSNWALHTYSTMDSPPVTDFVSLPQHESKRVIASNSDVVALLQSTPRGDLEFFNVVIDDGVALDGWMMKPPDFDPKRKYPLLMYVYSEPAGQTVLNRWRNDTYVWHLMLTQMGYVVASVDSRGTPAPRGREWRKSIYRQIGILASADQAKAVTALLDDRTYLDRERVGSWGWSGGGQMTLNAMFRYPEIYKTGVAVSFVSDQRLYDTIYQERFMGLPDDNEEGYRLGSPITFADRLEGKLLLVHGTGDDNVHYQSSEQLVDKLIGYNKKFSFMIYPDRSHSIDEKENTKRHHYGLMTDFLVENLPVWRD